MENLIAVTQMLNQHLAIDQTSQAIHPGQAQNLQDLKTKLVEHIRLMLDQDFEGLLQAMYRIDIEESAFHLALSENDLERLAEMIIQREIQKVIIRDRYKNL